MTDIFTVRVKEIILQIPCGMVTTYGRVGAYAGNRRGARQIARVLHSSSEKNHLPWHRVVDRNGQIPPRPSMGHLFQKELLEEEGVVFDECGKIDFARFLWRPEWLE
jgi:methylated-DNA-protein-cysteine methyltransferase-like protein